MAATFGELLRAGRAELDAAASLVPAEHGPGAAEAERQLHRLVAALSRCADDLVPDPGLAGRGSRVNPDAWTQAAAAARAALGSAAAELQPATQDDPGTPAGDAGQAASHLFGAGVSLTAGRDLLHTHFTTGPHGVPEGRSDWSAVVTSAAFTAALLEELGGWAARLAPLAVALGDSGLPRPVRSHLRTASLWLTAAAEAVERAQQTEPATERGSRLLSAVPAYTVPARRQFGDPEPLAGLCSGIVVSSERLRILAHRPPALASWSPAATAAAWRSTAAASAAAGHASGLVLRSLARRAAHVGLGPAVVARLQQATQAVQAAWPAWRAVVTAWGQLTTETTSGRSRAVTEIGDLVLRMGRLAWNDPAWTPNRARLATPRTPDHLAPDIADINIVAAAVHHTWDALAKLAATDLAAVQAAANAGEGLAVDSGRLYVPTRSQPDDYDMPRRFGVAPAGLVTALLDTYQAAITASQAAVRALDAAAVTLDLPSSLLATAREAAARQRHPRPQHKDLQASRLAPSRQSSATSPATPSATYGDAALGPNRSAPVTPARRPGPVEVAILRLGHTDQRLLRHAAEIDKAGRDLIAEATQTAAKSAPRTATPAAAARPNPAGDVAQLAASSFPSAPAAPLAGRRAEASPPSDTRQTQRPHPPRPRVR
jgi:hypothetical protein